MRLFILMLLTGTVMASNSLNLQLPSSPSNYSYDEVRSSDNMSCKNSIGGSTNLEFGVTGIVNNSVGIFGSEDPNNPTTKDIGVFARILIPLDGPKERINCNTLYELELRKKRLEVMKLEQQLKNLKNLRFENDDKNKDNKD